MALPPVGRPGGKARVQSFLFLRQCEELLYGSVSGSYTGALHMAVKVIVLGKNIHATTPTHTADACYTPLYTTNDPRTWASRVRCA
jgi:hypothetical protein